ncbi:SANT domain- and SWIRM domain-containing protein [Cryptosporidium ubiquitum]|uniref:SANT domain-and SWIRM domain-containing protein n=1 Tax=Cryptosporidium ubiquitum TaxID=857276 RepID=A0A1J4MDH6_9CRYT|nr:SANT domain- and SWIRM domain-containing protein [Cryptosporidium ubiquitum]OII72281.1 SANT domain- and SWIRM domain-containing protein [Cryptosporidium ubiquitum]
MSGERENESAPEEAMNLLGEDTIHPEGVNLLNTVEISTLSDSSIIKEDLSDLMKKGLEELREKSGNLHRMSDETRVNDLNIIDGKFRCDVCKKDTWDYRIRCAECVEYDLCLDCFCQGKSSNDHKPNHKYIPIGRYTFNLLTENWTAEEELLLMEAVSRYGLGNWSEISKYITEGPTGALSLYQKTQKPGFAAHTADECEKHYNNFYLNSKTKPLPDTRNYLNLIQKTQEITNSELIESIKQDLDLLNKSGEKKDSEPQISESSSGTSNSVSTESHSKTKQELSNPQVKKQPFGRPSGGNTGNKTTSTGTGNQSKPSTSVIGYMPLRGDFDVEYDNDAELLLADMEFRDSDTPQEKELKLQILEIYNSKLDERTYRKRFVIERNLLDIKLQQQKEKKRTKDERDLHSFLKPISRFQTEEEQEKLVSLLIEEKRIRSHLQKVQEWCSLGIRTLEEVKRYEEEKKRREDAKCKIINQTQGGALVAPGGLGLGNLKTMPKSGISTPFVYEGQARAIKKQQKNQISASNQNLISNPNPNSNSSTSSSIPNPPSIPLQNPNSIPNHTSSPSTSAIPIESYPGASLLTDQEKLFCDQIQLPPIFYILSKRILVQEAKYHLSLNSKTRKGSVNNQSNTGNIQNISAGGIPHLSRDEFSRVIRLDAQRAGQLYDFCLSFVDK